VHGRPVDDVADVLQIARARIHRYLERRGVIHIDVDAEVLHVDDDLAERDPALAQLATAAVSGLAPAGPAGAEDEKGREALLKYVLRPPLATERLVPGPDGLVRIALKRPFSDGTVAVDMDPNLSALPPGGDRPGAAVPYGSLLGGIGGLEVETAHHSEAAAGRRCLAGGARVVRSAAPLRHHRLALSPLG
jgi:hypothetical protein